MLDRILSSPEEIQRRLESQCYIADESLALTVYLALNLKKALLLEGEPGVGKTELAVALAGILGARLIRLQCYEGIELSSAAYEWNYQRQILRIRMEADGQRSPEEIERSIFSEEFLIKRPLLDAITSKEETPPVLLIDEIDRADAEFEAFLLEFLSDFQITIPEIGTVKADRIPPVVITSNRTREIHDALRRRCLYHWVPYPSLEKELKIILTRVPGISPEIAAALCRLTHVLRDMDLIKKPGTAELIDWTQAISFLKIAELDEGVIRNTIGCLLKYKGDIEEAEAMGFGALIEKAKARPGQKL